MGLTSHCSTLTLAHGVNRSTLNSEPGANRSYYGSSYTSISLNSEPDHPPSTLTPYCVSTLDPGPILNPVLQEGAVDNGTPTDLPSRISGGEWIDEQPHSHSKWEVSRFVERFDPADGSWTPCAPMPTPRSLNLTLTLTLTLTLALTLTLTVTLTLKPSPPFPQAPLPASHGLGLGLR